MHETAVVGDSVIDLELVSPPIREGRGARAVPGNFISHFVALEHVLEGADFHAKVFHQPDEHQNLILAIRMTMNPAFALQNFADGLELQIASGSEATGFPGLVPLA